MKGGLLDVLDVLDVCRITLVVCGPGRAKELVSFGRKTSGTRDGVVLQVRLADGLCCVLGQLGRQVDRGSLLLETSLLGLLILSLLMILFNDSTDSRNGVLTAQGHEAKIVVVTVVRNHFYVVDRLRNGFENSRRYASKNTVPSCSRRLLCHRDDRVLRATGSGVAAEDVPRGSWRGRARSGIGGRQQLPEDLRGT